MKAVEFPEFNVDLARDQPQYTPLPVYATYKLYRFRDPLAGINGTSHEKMLPDQMTVCYELSDEDIEELIKTKKLWFRQWLFGQRFHPIFLSVKSPFLPENKEHWPEDL